MLTFHGILEQFLVEVWNDAVSVGRAAKDIGKVSSDRYLILEELGSARRTHHQLLYARTLSRPLRTVSVIYRQHHQVKNYSKNTHCKTELSCHCLKDRQRSSPAHFFSQDTHLRVYLSILCVKSVGYDDDDDDDNNNNNNNN